MSWRQLGGGGAFLALPFPPGVGWRGFPPPPQGPELVSAAPVVFSLLLVGAASVGPGRRCVRRRAVFERGSRCGASRAGPAASDPQRRHSLSQRRRCHRCPSSGPGRPSPWGRNIRATLAPSQAGIPKSSARKGGDRSNDARSTVAKLGSHETAHGRKPHGEATDEVGRAHQRGMQRVCTYIHTVASTCREQRCTGRFGGDLRTEARSSRTRAHRCAAGAMDDW